MTEQINLFVWNNQTLFSNNYLENRLPSSALWKARKEQAAAAFEGIKKAYDSIKVLHLGPGEEAGLEDKFIRPVLKALGYEWDVQPTAERGAKKKRPDYALFKDWDSYETARKDKFDSARFFSQALTILEAKYWGRRLNDSDSKDRLDRRDPTAQTVKYLDDVYHATAGRIQWAVLTNGKQWRLFYYRASSRSGNFFEIGLEELILRNDRDMFLYFYLFFAKDAFVPDTVTGKNWLEQHLQETEEYASRVSDKLKNLIFDHIFEGLAAGFIEYRSRELGITEETVESLKEVFSGCLTLLYRLLFLLYAESRGLLPVNDIDRYYKKSLKKIKEDVSDELRISGLDGMCHNAYDYWSRLESLFRIIDKGDRALNVPIYNGGLFETTSNDCLSRHKISDPYIAEATELLTVDQDAEHTPGMTPFIDYSSLNVRHLGDIYEGLLEFHVRIASDEMVEVREKGKSLWKRRSVVKEGTKTYRTKKRGEVYIENSRHERKASGSYYTPHYIVEYIVANAVGPVLAERLGRAENLLDELDTLYAKQRKQLNKPKEWKHWEHPGEPKGKHIDDIVHKENQVFETLFDIKVLDPAMGSGHFLVHTVDFISDKIITFLADYPDNPVVRKIDELRNDILSNIKEQRVTIDESKLTEVNLIMRMVMKRCIYGVDLNEMAVELAKLTLWLDSFTLGAPLSFLDHHLKCGNSLIGSSIEELEKALSGHLFGINLEPLKRALRDMIFVSELPDATVAQVKESYKKYGEANKGLYGYKILLDMLIVEHFGIPDARKFLISDFDKIDLNRLHASLAGLPEPDIKVIQQVEMLAGEKRFFHWEIEFPEVFYERTPSGQKVVKQGNPGFDCVIGNPPYGLLGKESFFESNYSFVSPNWDMYVAFIEKGVLLLKNKSFISYIVPVLWQTGVMFEKMRGILISQTSIIKIINLPFNVFEDAYIDTGIFVFKKAVDNLNEVLVYEYPRKIRINSLDDIIYQTILQSCWTNDKKQIVLDRQALALMPKLFKYAVKLEDIAVSTRGVLASEEFISADGKTGCYPFFDGEMFRYEISPSDKFIYYSDDVPEKPSDINFFKGDRVFVRRLINRQDRLMSTCVKDFFVSKKDIYILKLAEDDYSPYYLCALLNSRLLSFSYLSSATISKKDDFRQATLEGIRQLPIPRISFTTPNTERKKRVSEATALYQGEIATVASNSGKWQNKNEDKGYDKDSDKKSSAKPGSLAEEARGYGLPEEGASGKSAGLGGEVHGVREGAGEYEPPEGASGEGKESTRPIDSTRYFETAERAKSYSEVSETLAVSVAKTIQSILNKSPEEIAVTPEWLCSVHKDIAGRLFPDWAGRLRDINVQVGAHTPPPYYEVPVHLRLYCEDLSARLSSVNAGDIEAVAELLAFADWRFQWIHPFKDFNGRVGRILLSALLFKLKLPPAETAAVEPKEREQYLAALRSADGGDVSLLKDIWIERLLAASQGEK